MIKTYKNFVKEQGFYPVKTGLDKTSGTQLPNLSEDRINLRAAGLSGDFVGKAYNAKREEQIKCAYTLKNN